VFTINGQHLHPSRGGEAHDLRSGHHEGLFVGNGYRLAGIDCCPSACETSTSDDGGHDNIHIGQANGLFDAFWP
jgi:hypothetical protein